MSLPDKFKFSVGRGYQYEGEVKKDLSNPYVVVSWRDEDGLNSMNYEYREVVLKVESGIWKIIHEAANPPNGVDADENPIYFGVEDLKLLDKFLTANGNVYLVTDLDGNAYDNIHAANLSYLGGHMSWMPDSENGYDPVAVYAQDKTKPGYAVSKDHFGPLRWKASELPTPESAKEKSIRELKETINKASDQLSQLEKEI